MAVTTELVAARYNRANGEFAGAGIDVRTCGGLNANIHDQAHRLARRHHPVESER